jgi:hypothetical protein
MKRVTAGLAVIGLTLAVLSSPGVASAGQVWTREPVPLPANAGQEAALSGVACVSTAFCVAVGDYSYARALRKAHALAERWNGSAWSLQHLAKPGSTWNSSLNGITCLSARDCVAVGTIGRGLGGVLIERWNGSTWAFQPSPPLGSGFSELDGIFCVSAASCTAVGGYDPGSGTTVALAEHWDGRSWTLQPVPGPAGADLAELNGIFCASANRCVAVGEYNTTAAGEHALAEYWDGSSWTPQALPGPAGSQTESLVSIDCAGPASCIAVGGDIGGAGSAALAEHWDGSAWSIQASPVPSGGQDVLHTVSCASAASCTAVGRYARGALAEYWNGSTWRQVQTTHPASHIDLSGVSCAFARNCAAVGNYRKSGFHEQAVAERE